MSNIWEQQANIFTEERCFKYDATTWCSIQQVSLPLPLLQQHLCMYHLFDATFKHIITITNLFFILPLIDLDS